MALLQSFLVLVLACSVSEVGGIGNMCLSNQLTSLDSSSGQINGDKQIILPTMNFSSCGVIRNWVVRADGRVKGSSPKTITLQLFKPDSTAAYVFTPISSTVVVTGIPSSPTTAYTFTDVGLQFSPGFVLGMKLPSQKFVGLHLTSYSTHFYAARDSPGDPAMVTVVSMNYFPVMSVSVMCSESCPTTPAPMATASSPEQMSTQTPVSSVNVDGSSSEQTSQDEASSIASSPTPTASVLPSPVSASLSSTLTTLDSSSSPTSEPLTTSDSSSSPSSSFLTMSASSSFANSALSSFSSPSVPPISTPTSLMSSPKSADQAVTTEPTSEPDGAPDPSSIVMVPLGSTSGPEVAIGVCIAAVLVLVLVVVFVIVLVAVCITRKNRKYKLSNSPMYDTPPDAYCTFGSERAMLPQNGHELIAMSSSYAEVESVPSAFVIGNSSATVYETPTGTLLSTGCELYYGNTEKTKENRGTYEMPVPTNNSYYNSEIIPNLQTRSMSGSELCEPRFPCIVDTLEEGGEYSLVDGVGVNGASSDEHEYHDADAFISDANTKAVPLQEKPALSTYGCVPTMDQRKTLDTLEISNTHSVYSNPGYTGSLPHMKKEQISSATLGVRDSIYEMASEEPEIYWAPGEKEEEIYAQMAQWGYQEIPRSFVNLSKKLGEGQFGEVHKAVLKTSQGKARDVAVKLVKEGAPKEERTFFLQEAATLGQFKHRHVIRLIGVVTIGEPQMMLMELLTGGDVKDYLDALRDNPTDLSSADLPGLLLQFCKQVVDGLACLARKGFVHRDIAARNILLDKDLNCKISDFGMTRNLEEDDYYSLKKGKKIPLKWTAPEVIFFKKYSTSSDVWSYGMLMYEIWSIGHKPWTDLDVQEMIKKLQAKLCQPPPPGCPRAVYEIMVKCWNYNSKERPDAGDVRADFFISERQLLSWKEKEVGGYSCSPLSRVLGAPLSEGEHLYKDLQTLYCEE